MNARDPIAEATRIVSDKALMESGRAEYVDPEWTIRTVDRLSPRSVEDDG